MRGLETNANCKEIISSITELAENLKLQVLVEYVETEDQKNLLHEIGCDHDQGYLFSPAVPLKAEANK
ncbi:MAG: EAL domain-containing protein [Clostridia bacterium]|nr:EAL domain-containing protein [Clostridia bacterium]